MKILFSPLGMTDPISLKNLEEGSFLHICRHYKPDKIYLYMSQEVLDYHKRDNRYLLALATLYEGAEKAPECELIEREDLRDVQIFDFFYRDFRDILTQIHHDYPKGEIFLNISSGTPAMKNALYVLTALSDFKMTPIQVDTPERRSNSDVSTYDPHVFSEVISPIDDTVRGANRTSVARMDNLNYELKKEIITNHLNKYNYQAAMDVAEMISSLLPEKSYFLIKAALDRSTLNGTGMNDALSKAKGKFYMYNGKDQDVVEYLLYLGICIKRGLLLEFIRGLSPLIFEIFILYLTRECSLDIYRYLTDKDKELRWNNFNDETGKEIERLLCAKVTNFSPRTIIYSHHLVLLIEHFSRDDKMVKLALDIREIEREARNKAAHQIIHISDSKLKRETGCTAKDIYDLLQEFMKGLSLDLNENHWRSYELMNRTIIDSFAGNA